MHNCVLYDCTKLFYSKTYGAKILKCEFHNTDVMPTQPSFLKFPVEIRVMIFKLSLKFNGMTPPLLAALRGNEELYPEALAGFRKINAFKVSKINICKKMSESAIQSIKKIEIPLLYYPLTVPW